MVEVEVLLVPLVHTLCLPSRDSRQHTDVQAQEEVMTSKLSASPWLE